MGSGTLWLIAGIGALLVVGGFVLLLLAEGASALRNPALRRPKPAVKAQDEEPPKPPRIIDINSVTTGGKDCQCQYCNEVKRIRQTKGSKF